MSVFTSAVTQTIEIPHDPGQSVTIRKLAPRHLEAAAKEQQRKSLADLKAIGPAFLKELQGLNESAKEQIANPDPLLLYDVVTLMEKGVIDWTYDKARTAENLEDLDSETQELIGRAVLRLAKPSLFETVDETKAAQKNG